MATLGEILANINAGLQGYAQSALNTPLKIGEEFAKTVGAVTLGVLVTVLVSVLREAFKPLFDSAANTAVQAERVADHLTTRPTSIKVKTEAPDYYDGSTDRAQAFLTELHMYYIVTGETDVGRQVLFALSRIKGGKDNSATKWVDAKRQLLRNYYEKVDGKTPTQIAQLASEGTTHPMNGWDAFKAQFEEHFLLHDEHEMARDNLDSLNMDKKTCGEYTTMFNGYAEMAQYDETYLLRKYREGLTKPLHDKVISAYPAPETLKDWKERALNLDRVWRKTQQKKKTEHKPFVPFRKPEPKRDPNAMDIDQMSIEQQNELKAAGKCFYCQEVGHIAKECPKKGRNPAGKQKKPWVKPQPQQRRTINFARTEEKKEGAEEAYNSVQKALSSLSEEEYQNFQDMQNRRGGF
jgi:hypothetical protein